MEVSIGEIVGGQHFVELNDLLREASGDQHLGFFDQLQLVLVNLEETHKTHLELLFPKTQRHNLKKHGENTSVFLRLIGEDMEQSTDSRYVAHFPKANGNFGGLSGYSPVVAFRCETISYLFKCIGHCCGFAECDSWSDGKSCRGAGMSNGEVCPILGLRSVIKGRKEARATKYIKHNWISWSSPQTQHNQKKTHLHYTQFGFGPDNDKEEK